MCCEEKKAAEKVPEIHTVIHPVTAEEVTLQKTLRISAMLALFQNIAGEDVDRLGYGDEGFRKEGILWMLTRMRTKISRMPRYGETVAVSTWTGVSGHGLYTRHYAISDRTGRCLVQACGIWVLVDGSSRTMIREMLCRFPNTVTGGELPPPRHLHLPEADRESELAVPYALCDLNGHLSNLRYPDLAESLIGTEYLRCREPVQVDIDYLREVLPEEKLHLEWCQKGDDWYFRGSAEGPCVQMHLQYRESEES